VNVRCGFSTSSWWVSRVIRFFTRATVSHAFLLIEGVPGMPPLVCEAEWCGWKLSTEAALTRGTTHIVKVVEPKISLTEAFLGSLAWLDEQYDYVGLLGMAWVSVGRWLGKKWRNPLRSSSSMFCSEAVVYVLQRAGYPGAGALDPQSISPEDLLQFLEATGSSEVVGGSWGRRLPRAGEPAQSKGTGGRS
jgi:hypothetical protein